MAGYIVQLSIQNPCWLISDDGSSARTCVKESAEVWATRSEAQYALEESLKHRRWPDARVIAVNEGGA
jgi:hypothetical protein